MIANKILKELAAMRIPCKFEAAEFIELEDDSIKILEHPLDLHIQLTPYAPMPFSLNWWTSASKVAMNMIEYRTVPELMLAIKELTNK